MARVQVQVLQRMHRWVLQDKSVKKPPWWRLRGEDVATKSVQSMRGIPHVARHLFPLPVQGLHPQEGLRLLPLPPLRVPRGLVVHHPKRVLRIPCRYFLLAAECTRIWSFESCVLFPFLLILV